mmetsp:Transcript_27599/g.77135  ORF Transcript_27599/g.77135 Transcript_27599/m.77135 type:complete len:245 (+) Transcript_27599:70-804(+)
MDDQGAHQVVVVGDSSVGKMDLVRVMGGQEFCLAVDYRPNSADVDEVARSVDGREVHMQTHHVTAGECYDQLRGLSYKGARVIVLCYRVDQPTSLENLRTFWLPEIKEKIPSDAPHPGMIVVGTMADLRLSRDARLEQLAGSKSLPREVRMPGGVCDEEAEVIQEKEVAINASVPEYALSIVPEAAGDLVPMSEGEALASEIGAAYIECSALSYAGVDELLDACAKACIAPPPAASSNRRCALQ